MDLPSKLAEFLSRLSRETTAPLSSGAIPPPPALLGGFFSVMTSSGSARAASIPRIDPALWEKHEGFRETLLLNFTDRRANQTLRRLGLFLLDLALECPPSWPNHPEGSTRSELRAALADLRHLQGFLSSVGREHILSSLGFEDTALSQFAVRQAREVETIANRIEDELEQWAAKAQ